ncbi:uncharacterized protein LOC131851011 [Achroia grisella]|uniref:uncharacterized protein LOC131851011 n=1 Tax=Achroia grisella TaxID=688607 RepID=UPI0027D229D5|nr:uncharacterized protein LOC131851011 [Achroia grisella]
MGSKRKKRKADDNCSPENSRDVDSPDSDSSMDEDKYKVFKIDNYCRQYPEDGGNFEYIVIYESTDTRPLGDRDLMSLGACLKRQSKGIKRFKRINKYKVGAIFERPGLANIALNNTKVQKDLHVKATIPATLTEITGVIKNVPIYMSNKSIYNGISSSRDVVSVRRFMRRSRDEDGNTSFLPTQSVAITFACPTLPTNVHINSWYFEVSAYTPPVTQCLKCLRYGHIGKFCKNTQRCSICGENHHFKDCTKNSTEAVCLHCNGNHIAISAECPIKKKKIQENKIKHKTVPFSSLFNEKSFPSLNTKTKPTDNINTLLQNDDFLKLIIASVIKIISVNKTDDSPLNSEGIKNIILDTFKISSTNTN